MTIITLIDYWDCECPTGYVRRKHQLASDEICTRCFARRNESPDSRESELQYPENMAPEQDEAKKLTDAQYAFTNLEFEDQPTADFFTTERFA